jgi:hypothetical protein
MRPLPELELRRRRIGVAAVYDEMRQAMHASIEGITWTGWSAIRA